MVRHCFGVWLCVAAVLAFAGCSRKAAPPETLTRAPGWAHLSWVRLAPEDSVRGPVRAAAPSRSVPGSVRSLPQAKGELLWCEFRFGPDGRRAAALAFELGEGDWSLYVDRDLDGDLSEESPLVATPVEKDSTRFARWPAVELVRPSGGRYALLVSAFVSGRYSWVEFRPACALAGKVELFGELRDCAIYDADVDGVFGVGPPEGPDRLGDAIWLDLDGDGRSGEHELRGLTRRLLLGRRAVSVEVSDVERSVRIEEISVPFAHLGRKGAWQGEELKVQLFSPDWGLLPPGGPEVPQGVWTLLAYEIVRKAEDGSSWVLAGAFLPPQAPQVELGPGGAELEFGPPLQSRAWVRYIGQEDPQQALILVTLRGVFGEQVRVAKAGEQESVGGFRIRSGSGEELASGKLEPLGLLPGAAGARWKPPPELQKGTPLTVAIERELGPFADGYRGESAFEFGVPAPVRLVVWRVEPASQAASAGIRPGDVIMRYDGKEIGSPLELAVAMRQAEQKTRVELVVLRKGTEYTLTLAPGRIGVETILAMP